MTEGGHNGAWYCSQTEERKTCPAQGCPKGYCEREHGWVPGVPEPDHYARPQPPDIGIPITAQPPAPQISEGQSQSLHNALVDSQTEWVEPIELPPAPQDLPAPPLAAGFNAIEREKEIAALVERLRRTYPQPLKIGDGIVTAVRVSQCAVTQRLYNPDGPAAADLIERLRAQLAETTEKLEIAQGLIDCACGYDEASDLCLGHHHILANREAEMRAKLAAAEAREGALLAALDPDKTKAAYIGEFYWTEDEMDEGAIFQRKLTVPWPTIKTIMAAIKARAALATEKHTLIISEGIAASKEGEK